MTFNTSNSTYNRWLVSNRPVRDLLPGINGAYTENQVADWLTQPIDQLLTELQTLFLNYREQLDPITASVEYLDFAASFCGFTGQYWDRNWPVEAKRQLLLLSFQLIWPRKGTAEVLSYVLNCFGILHIIQQGESFIIGRNVVDDPIGTIAWEYKIILPNYYYQTPTFKLVERLDFLYGPCWCDSEIVFSNEFFQTYQVLGFEDEWGFNFFSPDLENVEALSITDLED